MPDHRKFTFCLGAMLFALAWPLLAAEGEVASNDIVSCDTPPSPSDAVALDLRRAHVEREIEGAARHHIKLPALDSYLDLWARRPSLAPLATCRRMRYWSDGLRVTAYVFAPVDYRGRHPVLIYNRGGNRELGQIWPRDVRRFRKFLDAGFVVFASNYRGNDGGDGREEFGGSDVRDVLSLIDVARGMPYADPENVFMLGESRGGMMTFLALRAGATVRAAAVTAGPTDLARDLVDRPDLERLYRDLIVDYEAHREVSLRERSASAWPDTLRVPLLLQHGTHDWRVSVSATIALGKQLQELKRDVKVVIYEGDDHSLTFHRDEADRTILEWFVGHASREL